MQRVIVRIVSLVNDYFSDLSVRKIRESIKAIDLMVLEFPVLSMPSQFAKHLTESRVLGLPG